MYHHVHHAIDAAFGAILGRKPFFSSGVGSLETISTLLALPLTPRPPAEIEITWTGEPIHHRGITSYRGEFVSPGIPGVELPEALRTAHFELNAPSHVGENILERGELPLCVHLSATTDQAYMPRRFYAAPLVRRGILSLSLMSPFYAKRQPDYQHEYVIETLADQLLMNALTVEETCSLLAWFKARGFRYLGVTGYSLGGFGAAYTASQVDFPIAAIPQAMGANPGNVYLDTLFGQVVDWDGVHDSLDTEDMAQTRARLRDIFEAVSLENLPLPTDPDCAIIVAAEHDAVVPFEQSERLATAWGCELRGVDAGHITGIFRGAKPSRRAILDAFGTLIYKHP